MRTRQPQCPSPRKNLTAVPTQEERDITFAGNKQLALPGITAATASKKQMAYDYLDIPVEPTGRQIKFVLAKLTENPLGITTVEFTAMGVADPRPRIRDLRQLGWRIETIQEDPHDVGRYVLMFPGGDL